MTTKSVELYVDHKSTYAYLAAASAWELKRAFDVARDWLPNTFDSPDCLGSAEVGEGGSVIANSGMDAHSETTAPQMSRQRNTLASGR